MPVPAALPDDGPLMLQISPNACSLSLNPGVTQWINPFLGFDVIGTAADEQVVLWPHTGTFQYLRIELTAAPGVGKSWAFTFTVNGVDQFTILIADNATSGTFVGAVPITAGQRVNMYTTPSGSPAGQPLYLCWEFDSAEDTTSGYGIGAFGIALNDRNGLPFSGGAWAGSIFPDVVPLEGTVDEYYVYQDAGNGINAGVCDYYWVLNGVKQDGTGGTVDTVIRITTTTAVTPVTASKAINLPLVAGDRVRIVMDPVSGGDIRNGTVSLRYRGGRSHRAIVAGAYDTTPGVGYAPIRYQANSPNWQGSEVPGAFGRNGQTAFTLGEAWMWIGAPGAGNSRTTAMRVNSITSDLDVTIVDTNQLGSNLVDTAAVPAFAYTNLIHTPVSGPSASFIAFAMVSDTTPEGGNGNGGGEPPGPGPVPDAGCPTPLPLPV